LQTLNTGMLIQGTDKNNLQWKMQHLGNSCKFDQKSIIMIPAITKQ